MTRVTTDITSKCSGLIERWSLWVWRNPFGNPTAFWRKYAEGSGRTWAEFLNQPMRDLNPRPKNKVPVNLFSCFIFYSLTSYFWISVRFMVSNSLATDSLWASIKIPACSLQARVPGLRISIEVAFRAPERLRDFAMIKQIASCPIILPWKTQTGRHFLKNTFWIPGTMKYKDLWKSQLQIFSRK